MNNLHSAEETDLLRRYSHELLWYDPTVKPVNPEGIMPHGHAFLGNNMHISSRTDWNPRSTACVVYGRGGPSHGIHQHHDVGQVCIDGYGERLIVDPGGWGGRGRLYQVWHHNLLMFDGEQMLDGTRYRAELLAADFDDLRGGYWQLDLSNMYDGVERIRRTVVHLNPGIVAVLDEGDLPRQRDVSLRWHTATRADPDAEGQFLVKGEGGAQVASRVVRLGGEPLTLVHHHEYGFHRCELQVKAEQFQLISLFRVFAPQESPVAWKLREHTSSNLFSAASEVASEIVEVELTEQSLAVRYRGDATRGWEIPV